MTALVEHQERPERPPWALTGEDILAELDALHVTLSRLQARRLDLLARLDDLGHAKSLSARDTTELIALRHRLDPRAVRADLRAAHALTRYGLIASQLPGHCGAGRGQAAADEPGGATAGGESAGATTGGESAGATTGGESAGATTGGESAGATTGGESANATAGDESGGATAAQVSGDASAGDELASLIARQRTAQARRVVLHTKQAEVIATALEKAPPTTRPGDLAVAETEMVIAARTLNPSELRRLGQGVIARLDPDGPAPAEDTARSYETLWLTPVTLGRLAGGVKFGGYLAAENAELLRTLVDAGAKPRKTPAGELDPRTLGQRRADALGLVLRAAASTGGEIPAHGGIKPHLAITVDLDTLTRAGAPKPLTDFRPKIAADATGVDQPTGQATVTTEGPQPVASVPQAAAPSLGDRNRKLGSGLVSFGDGLSVDAIRRIACDAGVIPVVLGSNSEPLDVGREHRLVTPAIRRALIARDQGCIIPGCDAPPGHCDAHHVIHWIDGGKTAVVNLVLVCTPHHRAIHRDTWIVTITDGQVNVTRPDWTEPDPRPPPGR